MNQLQSMTIYDIIYQGVSHTNEDTCILTFVLFGKREFYEQVNIYEKKKSTVECSVQCCQQNGDV